MEQKGRKDGRREGGKGEKIKERVRGRKKEGKVKRAPHIGTPYKSLSNKDYKTLLKNSLKSL